MLQGIDVSKWQGEIDWSVANTKADFAIIRAGSCNAVTGICYTDTQFERNWELCRIPKDVYWYCRPNHSERTQAEYLLGLLETNEADGKGLPQHIWMDIEENGGMTKAVIQRFLLYFQKIVHQRYPNIPVGIYTRGEFWNSYIGHLLIGGPLWIARYVNQDHPWVKNDGRVETAYKPVSWDTFDIWQYGDKGPGKEYGMQSEGLDMNLAVADFYEIVEQPVEGIPAAGTENVSGRIAIAIPGMGQWDQGEFNYAGSDTYPAVGPRVNKIRQKDVPIDIDVELERLYRLLNLINWDEFALWKPGITPSLTKQVGKFQQNFCEGNYFDIVGEENDCYLVRVLDADNIPEGLNYRDNPTLIHEYTARYQDKDTIVGIGPNGTIGFMFNISHGTTSRIKKNRLKLFPELPYFTKLKTTVSLRSTPHRSDADPNENRFGYASGYVTITEYHLEGHNVWGYVPEREGWVAIRHQPKVGTDRVDEYVPFLGIYHGPPRPPDAWFEAQPEPEPPPEQNGFTNQVMLNELHAAFGDWWNVVEGCQLEYLINNRGAEYTGPTEFSFGLGKFDVTLKLKE